jgi:hypothetical protein
MKMKMTTLHDRTPVRIYLIALCLAFGLPGAVSATATLIGCFTCSYAHITGMGQICKSAGCEHEGDGWECYEDNSLPWPDGPECSTNGQACYETCAGGGDGGSGGGGGGSSCGGSGFCPAECFSCGGGGGRPAI